MRRLTHQRGSALLLFIVITSTLAILAAMLVVVITNLQTATADDRSRKQSFYAAEAALDSAVRLAKVNKTMSTTTEWLTPAELEAAFSGVFPPGATVTYKVYDNLATVDYNIKWDQGGPSSAITPDHRVWVEATVTYKGKTTRTRVLVQQTAKPFAEALPKAVTYSDTGITLKDHGDIYALDPTTGAPDTSGPPYQTSITAGGTWTPSMPSSWAEVGRFTANTYSDLAAPGTSTQSLGIRANGSVALAGHSFTDVIVAPGTVGFLSDYFDQAAQVSLQTESMAAYPVRANAGGTLVSPSKFTPSSITTIPGVTRSGSSAPYTYTFANDIVLSGNLTLRTSGSGTGVFPAGTTFNFRSLYTDNSLAVNGQLTLNTTALYVGKNFTIAGPTSSSAAVKHWLGSVFVKATPADTTYGGNVNWSGYASVTSRDYLNPSADPQPMWMGRYWKRSGTYNDEYGCVWIPGNSSTSVVFQSTGASTALCPLMCTTEKTIFTGNITFGTRDYPMTFFFMCDNNGIYPQTFELGQSSTPYTGTYYGLMVINEAPIVIIDNNGSSPTVQGAIFGGCPYDPTYTSGLSMSDVTLQSYASIAYDQYVVGRIATSSLKTTVLVTETVPGSWQQLPLN